MHFVAYLTYNNNGDLGGSMTPRSHSVNIGNAMSHVHFDVGNNDCILFRWRFSHYPQQLTYYQNLQAALKKEFGQGFTLAVCPQSDCSNDRQMRHFCQAMKALDSETTTLMYGGTPLIIPEALENDGVDNDLAYAWKREPYRSAKILARTGLADPHGTPEADMYTGVDYFIDSLRGGMGGRTLAKKLFGVEGPETESKLDDATLEKIARIVQESFARAHSMDFDRTAPALLY